ncbi:PQQ-binding-like beta-propeller repeat protein [Novipirellula caenicola]|uniref:Outer membrane protein assembly factor BamB n=1 Tax=Novipirellula caenicola TaxID=1536901 RepID=A0ABP9VQS2_9BACT
MIIASRTLVILSACIAISCSCVNARGDDAWPAFRGPDGDGVVRSGAELPLQWSSDKNIDWRTELPGKGWSSPVCDDGRIYVTTAIPSESGKPSEAAAKEFSLSLLAIDAATGKLLKTIPVMSQTKDRSPKIHSKNSHASPTPIIDGDRIFVHFGYQGTACVSKQGEVLWTNRDLYFSPQHGNGGSPILVNNKLIFTCDGDKDPKIVALDADTGELAWQTLRLIFAIRTFSFATPTLIEVDGQKQVIAPGSDCVFALNPNTGEVIWDVRYDGYSVIPKPIFHRGLVFVSTSYDSSKLLAIRPTGTGIVTDTHIQWRSNKSVSKTPSMVAADGLIYWVSDDGIAMCAEADTGEIVYRKRIGGNFSASLLMSGDRIYFTSEEGVTTVVRAGREFEVLATNPIEERTLASLGVFEDSVLLRTADALYRISQ